MRHITDDERRARLAVRHAIAPGHRVTDPEAATRAMTVLHATEPPTVYLSVAARVEGATIADVDRALYDDRSLVKQLAMRRTLFVFPRDLLPAAWGGPAARVAGQERRRIAKDVVAAGLADDGDAWLDEARSRLLAALADPGGRSVRDLRAAVPFVGGTVSVSPGTKWGGEVPLAPRVLGWLGAEGQIVRGRNAGHWRLSRPAWTRMSDWLGAAPAPLPEPEAYAALVGRWLRSFGPGTEADLVWWLGATKTAVRRALADLEAVPVSLDGGLAGWVLPDDEDEADPVEPWAALLPVLDPTTMGWRDREFYLDPDHTPYLFDSNGNGGTTAWWNGRVVGCWVQDDTGLVHVVSRGSLPADATAALAVEAERLTAWLAGVRVSSVYSSLQMRSALLP
jgi:hypothetical protein